MRIKLLLLLNLIFFSTICFNTANAQDKFTKGAFYKWEGYSKEGHCIFGVSKNKEDALLVIQDFNRRNAKTKYKMIFHTFKKSTTDNPKFINEFYELHPKRYRVLRMKDLATAQVYNSLDFKQALTYLEKSSDLSPEENKKYLKELVRDLKKYRFKVID